MTSRRVPAASSPRRRSAPIAAGAVVFALAGLSLAGCASTVIVEAAPDAQNPKCAEIMLRLPDEVSGEKERQTSSQGTEAWGDPSIAVLRCGVTPPGPTTDPCVSVGNVDWISRPSEEGDTWRFTSYGRTPAVEVLVNRKSESGANVLAAVSPALEPMPAEAKCVGAEDVNG